MATQIHSSNDRTRTNWTPVMEQYFIDLMLDQLHRGNRMGHTFNKQAWTDMLTMFNANFGTKYDRDIFKSHYTNLWKQYNDVKNLLEQSGFSWDDTRKMVIADDDVWETFIQNHPDAQCYKRKSLMNFTDLCLIYAYTTADGRYSRSSHDIDLDDDIQGVNIGFGIASPAPASTERVKTNWTTSMDQYFIELMLEHVKKCNKDDRTFSKHAWKDMLTAFSEKFCCQYGRNFLRRHYKKLFKYYTGIRSLLERDGFSWDEKQQMIIADDGLWDKYIRAHPDAHSYRNKTLLNYEDLSLIYGNDDISGHLGRTNQNKNFEDEILQVNFGYDNDGYLSTGSDVVGPFWTSAMDRYLIDLLQDQALRGNKVGHNLTTKAWIEVVGLFCAKFGSEYDRDSLENRYRHLRREYNGIKILEQNGFYWDENREMVTADDYVWDTYTQVYPEAQSYRNKSVPSYHKLCVIYGEESPNARYDHGEHHADRYSEGPVLMIEEDLRCHLNGDSSKADWTPMMDRYFIDLMLEEVYRGNQVDYSSDNQGLLDIALLFEDRFGLQLDEDTLKIRYKSYAKLYEDMKILLRQRGFSWDESRHLVTAQCDVWDAYIKEHPDARSYRTKPKPSFNDLCLIYGNSTSDEGGNQSDQGAKLRNGTLRNNWTPQMDRLFIDLMLQHVRQGSLVDGRFDKHAWSDMVTKLRSEFGSLYHEDVLRSRFMNLRNLFIDMKSLLDQSGFAWDELQQLIIADDDLWNAYVKEYPNLRSYLNRTLPNYNDLFMIYGNINNGRNNCSDHSVDANGYILGLNGAVEDGPFPTGCDETSISWTKPMEAYFIKLMLEQVLKVNMIGQRFDEKRWSWIIASFNEKFGLLCDKEAAENWYLSLMEEYDNITKLLNQSGFSWDETEQMIIADDDDWEACIQDHPGAIKYRNRRLDSYHDLCMIYSNSIPVGRSSHLAANMEMHFNDSDMGIRGMSDDVFYPPEEFEISDQRKKRKAVLSSTMSSSRKVQRTKMEAQEVLRHSKDDDKHVSIEVIVDALQTIPDMDDELFLEACKLLENERRAKVFVGMDVSQRRNWLFKKLYK